MVPRRTLAALAVFAWSATARATPDFPAVVVQTLGLPGVTVDAPQGCTICHPTDAGGTSMRPFGALLQQYGAKPYDESSLRAALAQVKSNEPQLLQDITAGRDPNDDTGAANVHTPEYGCAASARRSPPSAAFVASVVLAALLAAWRRARLRERPRAGLHVHGR